MLRVWADRANTSFLILGVALAVQWTIGEFSGFRPFSVATHRLDWTWDFPDFWKGKAIISNIGGTKSAADASPFLTV